MIIYILGESHSGKSEAARYLRRKYSLIEISLADIIKRFLRDLYGFTDEQLWGISEFRNMPDPRFPRKFSLEMYEAPGEPSKDLACLSPREALQTLGEAMRGCFSDTWVRKLFETFKELERGGMGYIPTIGLFGDGHPALDCGKRCLLSCSVPLKTIGIQLKPEERLGPFYNFLVPDVRYRNEHEALRRAGALGFRLTSPTQGEGLEGKLAEHRSETEQRAIPDSELRAVIRNDGTLADLYAKLDALIEKQPG